MVLQAGGGDGREGGDEGMRRLFWQEYWPGAATWRTPYEAAVRAAQAAMRGEGERHTAYTAFRLFVGGEVPRVGREERGKLKEAEEEEREAQATAEREQQNERAREGKAQEAAARGEGGEEAVRKHMETLGIEAGGIRWVEGQTIRRAYRKAALASHPDKDNSEAARMRYQAAQAARQALEAWLAEAGGMLAKSRLEGEAQARGHTAGGAGRRMEGEGEGEEAEGMEEELRDAGGGGGRGGKTAREKGGGEWRERLAKGLSGARRAMERAVRRYKQRAKAMAAREAAARGTTVEEQQAARRVEKQRERRELREEAVEAEMERERQAARREWEGRREEARRAAEAAQEAAETATAEAATKGLLDFFGHKHWLMLPLAMWGGRRDSKSEVKCRIVEIWGETRDHEHMEFRVQSAPGEPWWRPWWTSWATVVGRTRHGAHQMAARLVPRGEAEEEGGGSDTGEDGDGDGGAEHEQAA